MWVGSQNDVRNLLLKIRTGTYPHAALCEPSVSALFKADILNSTQWEVPVALRFSLFLEQYRLRFGSVLLKTFCTNLQLVRVLLL